MKLGIITHVGHWRMGSRLVALGGFVREIDYWAKLFDEVEICVPLVNGAPPEGAYAYEMNNISLRPCPVAGGLTLGKKLGLMLSIPKMLSKIHQTIRTCDAIQVRCPGNLGLLGLIAMRFSRKPRVGKFAGEWGASVGVGRWTCWAQRFLMARKSFGGPVLINSMRDSLESSHLVPVFNTTLTQNQVDETREEAHRRTAPENPKLLFVGRLGAVKCVDDIISAVAILRRDFSLQVTLDIVGDGKERSELEALVRKMELSDCIKFHGMTPPSELGKHYAAADILVLASSSEGWPKVLTEAMLYGLPCIASNVSVVPQILGEGKRGILIEPRRPRDIAEAVRRLIGDPDLYRAISLESRKWAEAQTLEALFLSVRELLEDWWQMPLKSHSQTQSGAFIEGIR
ncbi:glycosyltransferase family 4 protein [bacterium]|nr:glycosyltransferase family 4 protein [bacterium]